MRISVYSSQAGIETCSGGNWRVQSTNLLIKNICHNINVDTTEKQLIQ